MANFAKSPIWRKSSNSLYSLGAAIVMLGALAKLTHFQLGDYPVGNTLLAVGLITEAIIFTVSAFEPPMEQTDWSLVYPELAGLEPTNLKKKTLDYQGFQQFGKLLSKTKLDDETFEKLGSGLQNLGNTASKLHDISDASIATNEYVQSMKQASASVNLLSEASGDNIESYRELTRSLGEDITKIKQNSDDYSNNIGTFNKNLTSLNAIYELSLKDINEKFEAVGGLQNKINETLEVLTEGLDNSKIFREQTEQLSQNLAALNEVYGNMLTAMNFKQV